jgi:putative acetyltransferase
MGSPVAPAPIAVRPESPDRPEVRVLLARLDEYLQRLYPPESNHLLGIDELLKPDIRFFVARRGGRAFGCGALKLEADRTAEVKRVYVDPAARGLGAGKALLRAIVDEAGRSAVALLRLETGIHQPEAIGLFQSCGFRETGPFPPYGPDPLSRFFALPLPR